MSVLENMHASEAFKVILKEGMFEKLTTEQFRTVRRRIIECILATDMANHGKNLNEMKVKFESFDIFDGNNVDLLILPDNANNATLKNNENVQMILSECVHTADISNPAKMNSIFIKWTEILYQEFFTQGDTEKELGKNPSFLCDRETTNIYKSQVGFLKFVVIKQFETMYNVMPEIKIYLDNIKMNLKYSEDQVELEIYS